MNMPPARDSEVLPVEGGASGAAAAFDGNLTHDLDSWIFPNGHWRDEAALDVLHELMVWTTSGHLAWVVFPPSGFRL
jgi:hypothetical protein